VPHFMWPLIRMSTLIQRAALVALDHTALKIYSAVKELYHNGKLKARKGSTVVNFFEPSKLSI
jgi:hypothetical protein